MAKNAKGKKGADGKVPDPFNLSLGAALQHALTGWYAQYIHDMIEGDAEFRERMREHAAYVFETLAKGFREGR